MQKNIESRTLGYIRHLHRLKQQSIPQAFFYGCVLFGDLEIFFLNGNVVGSIASLTMFHLQ